MSRAWRMPHEGGGGRASQRHVTESSETVNRTSSRFDLRYCSVERSSVNRRFETSSLSRKNYSYAASSIDARDEVYLRPHASQAVSLIARVSIARAQLPLGGM